MQLKLNDTLQFSVTSFQESLELRGEDIQLRLNVTVDFTDSLETLIDDLDGIEVPAFEITGIGNDKRTYTGFIFDSINQTINENHEIDTGLVFVKNAHNN